MTQPAHEGRRRSAVALLVLLGALSVPASAAAMGDDAIDPGTGDPPPACIDGQVTPDCPPVDPDPEPEPAPEPEPSAPALAPPPPPAPAPSAAPTLPSVAPRLWTPARSAAVRADRRTGRLTLARVTCWQGPCTITAPAQTTVRIGGKRFVARVTGARRSATGQTTVLRLQLTRAALRQLDRATTPTTVEVSIGIRSPEHTVEQTAVLSLR